MFSFPSNPIMESIEKLYDISKDSLLAEIIYSGHLNKVAILKEFWDCTDEQAILLSILVQSYFENKSISTGEILDYTDLTTSAAPYINNQLHFFIEKKWITPSKDLKLHPLSSFTISNNVIKSVLSQEKLKVVQTEIDSSFKLLQQFQNKLSERVNRIITYAAFTKWTFELIENNTKVELAEFIVKSKMDQITATHFIYACNRYYNGSEYTDYDDIIRELTPLKEDQYKLRQSFRNGSNFLLKEGFLKECQNNYDIMMGMTYKLTNKSIEAFDKSSVSKINVEAKLFQQIDPTEIVEKELIFDTKEQNEVNKLSDLLLESNFSKLSQRLTLNGMRKGISILLYGHPGTGKTETVMQIAKKSNRIILMADASKIRSKWVGETEKNMKALFDEYKLIKESIDAIPILLFNEADAILGKRKSVSDRADQMENTMQNILLQELENFEGIFIATTNLVDNLDKAFDRRFLYKIKFEKPGAQALQKIWQSKFPSLKKGLIKKMSSQYNLTGGQIENLNKKIIVDQLLNEELTLNEKYFHHLCSQELILESKSERNQIGFKLL